MMGGSSKGKGEGEWGGGLHGKQDSSIVEAPLLCRIFNLKLKIIKKRCYLYVDKATPRCYNLS
jgi:hypothetical protein